MPKINTYLIDCMEHMANVSDKYYSLALVDPEYGIGADKKNSTDKKQSKKSAANSTNYGNQKWDSNVPDIEYFKELFRVSKNQIIWGVNYYPYNLFNGGRIYWNKCVTMPTYSDGELAYNSKTNSISSFTYAWHGMIQGDMKNKQQRIHPTEKPIALYKWLLNNYAKPNDKIYDSHGGSFSHAIACYDLGFDLDICELDPDYYRDGVERFEKHRLKCEEIKEFGFAKTELNKINPTLF